MQKVVVALLTLALGCGSWAPLGIAHGNSMLGVAVQHCPARTLQLRGGSSGDLPEDPRSWEVAHVLAFLERLRPRFKDRTGHYKQLFADNDVDGTILLGLSTEKLEKIGVASLGHREHMVAAVHELREASGMQRGPAPSTFDAAMLAQQAPPKHPPRKIATTDGQRGAVAETRKWTSVPRTAWTQEGRDVDVYIFLDGVGNVHKDDVSVQISELSVDVRVSNLNGTNYVYHLPRLYDKIVPCDSFWKVRPSKIHLKLYKAVDQTWIQLERRGRGGVIEKFLEYSETAWDTTTKRREAKYTKSNIRDPGEGLLDLIKDMYNDGDADTRRAISQAWTKASEKAGRGDSLKDSDMDEFSKRFDRSFCK